MRRADVIDLMLWTDEAVRCAKVCSHERHTFAATLTESCTWHALHSRMLRAGLHELRDAETFRAVKTSYLAIWDSWPAARDTLALEGQSGACLYCA